MRCERVKFFYPDFYDGSNRTVEDKSRSAEQKINDWLASSENINIIETQLQVINEQIIVLVRYYIEEGVNS